MSDPLVARTTDPHTSHAGVAATSERRLTQRVWSACYDLGEFTDTELVKQIKHSYGIRDDRGVVARIRYRLEKRGLVARTGEERDGNLVFKVSFDGHMTARGSGY